MKIFQYSSYPILSHINSIMDNYPNYINNFYNNPTEITDTELVINTIHHYKKKLLENNYMLYIAENDTIVKLFVLFLFYYGTLVKEYKMHNQNSNKKIHCAIDYEFSTDKVRQVALMQINFSVNNHNYLWIIDPKKYDDSKIDIINNILLLNENIYKVLHGSESLDIPYMYDVLFKGDKQKIFQFTKKLVDTRFLCEYVRKSLGVEGKCSIYDAMLYFNTIDKNKYDELEKINNQMMPIQDVNWEINKMSSLHISYALHDVLRLITLIEDIYKKILTGTPLYVRTYYYIIKILRFVILERKNVTNVLEFVKNIVNPMNNYIVTINNNKNTLIEKFNQIMEECILEEGNDKIYVNHIESINYVRGTFNFLFKYVVFYVLNNKYKVYKNKSDLMKEKIDIDKLYGELDLIGFNKITNLLKIFEKYVDDTMGLED